MSNIKFSELPNLGTITANTIVPVVSAGTNYTITAANLQSYVNSSTGNVTGGNVLTGGVVSATGNVTGNYVLGNGSQLTGLPATYGNANVVANLAALGSNPVSTTGNVTGGNLLTGGLISATGNITGGNANIVGGTLAFANANIVQTNPLDLAITGAYQISIKPASGSYQWTFGNDGALTGPTGVGVTGYLSATGNTTGGNIRTAGLVSATGNITGGNILTSGLISATGTVTGSSLLGSVASASGNITGGNILTAGIISSTGNINGGNLTLANGQISVTYTPSTITGVAITAQGANTNGGTGYFEFLKATNQSGGATNPNKSFRLNSTGGFEIVNSAYTATLFSIADNGNTIVQGNLQVTGNLTYVNTTNLSVTNALIILANAATTPAQANGGGIQLNGANANIIYTNGNDAWNINKTVAVTGAVTATTTVSAAGNITGGNVLTGGVVSATGNVTGNYVLGNGALLTGVITSVANINSGTSNVTVVSSGGNITVGVGGTSNVAVFATTGEYVTGVVSASGNVTGGNVLTGGIISSTGNITGGNLSGTSIAGTLTTAAQTNITSVGTLGALTVTANVTGGNVLTAGIMSSTGNITGGNISATAHTGTTVSVLGNVTGGNVLTGGLISSTATVTGGNLATGGTASATGNITGGNVLTAGIMSSTGNATHGNILTAGLVSATANVTGGNITTAGLISATGNITGGNISATAHTGTTVSVTGNITAGNVINTGISSVTGNITAGNVLTGGLISATGNITTANSFVGNLVGTTVSITGNVSAGNVIVNGQPTTYGVVTPAYMVVGLASSITSFGLNSTVIFDTVVGNTNSQTSYNASTGVFTLTAGVAYDMSFTPSFITFTNPTTGYLCYQWVDATTNTPLDSTGTGMGTGISSQDTTAQQDNATARVIYTPSTNQTVKLLVTSGNGTVTLRGSIGTQAVIKPLNPTIAVQATATGTVSATVVANTSPVGTLVNGGSSTSPVLTILTLAIPTAGTWRLDAELRVYVPSAGYMAAAFYDNGTLIPGSEYFVAAGGVTQTGAAAGQYSGFMSYNLTTTGARTVTVGIWSTTSVQTIDSADGRTWARATQIDSIFALNTLGTMSTTGNVTVGGNLSVTGNITSTPAGFRATTPVTNVSVNNGSSATMIFGTEEVDTKNWYDTATGRFTPNIAGYYSVDWFIVTSANGANELLVTLNKNGTDIAWSTNVTTATAHWNGVGGSAGMIYFNGTTDYILVKLTNNSGSTATVYSGSLSYFSAYLIR
jgi:hypothetical protein